jgi:3-deoxy-D-manno-octulosonic-acid transferase
MNPLDLLYIPLAAVTAPAWGLKKREGWPERFGKIHRLPAPAGGARGRVLLHAVSVGEVAACRELVPMLAREGGGGGADVVVSVTTDTGLRRAKELYGKLERVHVVRYPLDFSWAVERFLDAVRPDVVALVELEVWPNFVAACAERGVPIGVINGRLSARSFKGYRKIRAAIGPTFKRLKFAAVQDADYAHRFEVMGVPRERVTITGTMKWDAVKVKESDQPSAEAIRLADELGIDRSRPLIVAGSTAEDEEALLHAATPPGVQLLCAPRKPEHVEAAAAALPGCVRLSKVREGARAGGGDARADRHQEGANAGGRFLVDTIGDLSKAYQLASVVVMGRSFGSLYGSDPIEPIALGKATLIGPRFGDFESSVRALEAGKGVGITTRENLGSDLARLVAEPEMARELAANGRRVILDHQGASRKHAELLLSLLPSEPIGDRMRKVSDQSLA